MMTVSRLRGSGFRDAGHGAVFLEGSAALLFAAWRREIRGIFAPFADTAIEAPLLIAPHVLARSGYAASFPQHVVATRGRGRPATGAITPAACLHVYPTLGRARLPRRGRGVYIESSCARYESGRWRFPFRLLGFRMAELVLLGSQTAVEDRRVRALDALTGALARLRIDGRWVSALDPFFAPGARLLQRLGDAKHEFRVTSPARVALASINRHGDHFGRAFRIRAADGTVASSACLAVGLERLTAYGLLAWGGDPRGWPRELRP